MMMEETVIELVVTTGVGGALAVLMFFFYRKDANDWTSRWEAATKDARQKHQTERSDLIHVIQDNTQAITGLREELKGRQRDN